MLHTELYCLYLVHPANSELDSIKQLLFLFTDLIATVRDFGLVLT